MKSKYRKAPSLLERILALNNSAPVRLHLGQVSGARPFNYQILKNIKFELYGRTINSFTIPTFSADDLTYSYQGRSFLYQGM